MSIFSSVDSSDDPSAAVAYLDWTARAQAGMKQYAAAAHALRDPQGFVLDVGCGAGHDLALLAACGLRPLGIDPSATMCSTATRLAPGSVLRATGEALPFRSGSLTGCRMERVLIHVAEPLRLLGEVARCLGPSALLTVFEPDWSAYRVRERGALVSAGWLAPTRHSDAGGRLWDWVETSGFVVLDQVEELSVWRSFEHLQSVINLDRAIAGAIAAGRIDASSAAEWRAQQVDNDKRGAFFSLMRKVLIIAVRESD